MLLLPLSHPMQPHLPTKHTVANASEQKSPSPLASGSTACMPALLALRRCRLPIQGVCVPSLRQSARLASSSDKPFGRTVCAFAALAISNSVGVLFN